ERLRTPRVAAYAGIIFALLTGTSMALVQLSIPFSEPYESDWLVERPVQVSLAVALVPFAGIAFLWFMGVIRDQLGALEDQFFSTLFLGSGLLFLGSLFVWAAVLGAVLASHEAAPATWAGSGGFIFAMSMVKVISGVVILRMGGVFMFSSGTIWLRTEAMPRWLVWFTYGISLILVIGGPSVRAFRLSFPIWVLVVSILVLQVQGQLAHEDGTESGGVDSPDSE
ncbi:MAG: hypothetical protein GY724_18720, partial [Actinomycetia bacterium]|nr:hypothetical protein [Actinomycetes bacterium]